MPVAMNVEAPGSDVGRSMIVEVEIRKAGLAACCTAMGLVTCGKNGSGRPCVTLRAMPARNSSASLHHFAHLTHSWPRSNSRSCCLETSRHAMPWGHPGRPRAAFPSAPPGQRQGAGSSCMVGQVGSRCKGAAKVGHAPRRAGGRAWHHPGGAMPPPGTHATGAQSRPAERAHAWAQPLPACKHRGRSCSNPDLWSRASTAAPSAAAWRTPTHLTPPNRHKATVEHTDTLGWSLTRCRMSRLNQGMSTDQGHTSSVPTKSLLRCGFFFGIARLSTPLAAMSTANSYALTTRSMGLAGEAAHAAGALMQQRTPACFWLWHVPSAGSGSWGTTGHHTGQRGR